MMRPVPRSRGAFAGHRDGGDRPGDDEYGVLVVPRVRRGDLFGGSRVSGSRTEKLSACHSGRKRD